jgi:hypothetical protein
MKLPTAVGEADLVHQLVDQEDPASAYFEHVRSFERVRHTGDLESWARITHDDQHIAGVFVSNETPDELRRIALAAVADGIGQCLPQRQLNLELMPDDAGLVPEGLRDPVGHRADGCGICGNHDVELAGRAEWQHRAEVPRILERIPQLLNEPLLRFLGLIALAESLRQLVNVQSELELATAWRRSASSAACCSGVSVRGTRLSTQRLRSARPSCVTRDAPM